MIGALSYPLSKILGGLSENAFIAGSEVSRSEAFKQLFFSLNATKVEGELHSDIQKIYFYDKRRREAKSDAVALEKLYGPSEVELVYLINNKAAREILGDDWLNLLRAAAWGIVRIGQKESLASVEFVDMDVAVPCELRETRFYFLSKHARPVSGSWHMREIVDWTEALIGDYSKAPKAVLFIPDGLITVELTGQGAIYKIGDYGCIVGPKVQGV